MGRKRTLLSHILNPGTVKVHEFSRATEQWQESVRSCQSRAREIISDDVRSGIMSEMCLEHTHIYVNSNRLSEYAAVRSEIETFFHARQSSSNPHATDIGSLEGQKSVPNVARLVRVTARKARQAKAKLTMAKEKAKVASCKHERRCSKGAAITGGNGVTWKKDCFALAKTKGKGGKG